MKTFLDYEIQRITNGNVGKSPRNLIETACGVLSRSQSTAKKSATTKYIKNEEEKLLSIWAENLQLWVEPPKEIMYLTEGAEQKVYLAPNGKSVYKTNTGIFYLSWLDYFHSLCLHNLFFPATAYELIGLCKDDTQLLVLVKQPYVITTEPTDLALIRLFLESNGFSLQRNNDYKHQTLGIILEDLHDENVLTSQGVLFFIDTVFYLM
jgi:hypothetical protein